MQRIYPLLSLQIKKKRVTFIGNIRHRPFKLKIKSI